LVEVKREAFGTLPTGEAVDVITVGNARGTEVRVATYGGIILSLRAADRAGQVDDIVLGFDDLEGYLRNSPYFGAIVGRYGNRIARGRFTLDGSTYELATNNGPNHLHGGLRGFDKVVWKCAPFARDGASGAVFTHTSPHGDEGYPGTLDVKVAYTLTDRDELSVDYRATTDRPTVVNLTQHSYFNLAGAGLGDVLGHDLKLDAEHYTPVDETLIPLGTLAPVAYTPFDFRSPARIGARIRDGDTQLARGGGYDHNFVLKPTAGNAPRHAAHVYEPTTGRTLDVHTTEPGVQFYSGNFLDGSISGKAGRSYGPRAGFCLETQHFPDSPNEPAFPSTVLRPGEEYRSRTVFRFGVRE
jgi:aldose 1-epimerase